MRLINADAIPWRSDYKYPHVEGFQTVMKMAIDNMPTVDAIPVEWINKYTNEHRTYIHAFSEMVACWYDEKENREYEMASDELDIVRREE